MTAISLADVLQAYMTFAAIMLVTLGCSEKKLSGKIFLFSIALLFLLSASQM